MFRTRSPSLDASFPLEFIPLLPLNLALSLAHNVLPSTSRMSVMHSQPSFRTAICSDYEKLLFACQRELENLLHLQQQIASLPFADAHTSNQLLRLEAAYARAYAHLESHDEDCQLCHFVSKLGHRNLSSSSIAGLQKKSFV